MDRSFRRREMLRSMCGLTLVGIGAVGVVESSASVEWGRTYSGRGKGEFTDIVQTESGAFVAVGSTGQADQNCCERGWMTGLTSDGSQRWSEDFGTDANDYLVSADSAGEVVTAVGERNATARGDHQPWALTVDTGGAQRDAFHNGTGSFSDLVVLDDGYLAVGSLGFYRKNNLRSWAYRRQTNGDDWSHKIADVPAQSVAEAVVGLGGESFLVAGSAADFQKTFLAAIESGGTAWKRLFDLQEDEDTGVIDLATTDEGPVLLAETDEAWTLIGVAGDGQERWRRSFDLEDPQALVAVGDGLAVPTESDDGPIVLLLNSAGRETGTVSIDNQGLGVNALAPHPDGGFVVAGGMDDGSGWIGRVSTSTAAAGTATATPAQTPTRTPAGGGSGGEKTTGVDRQKTAGGGGSGFGIVATLGSVAGSAYLLKNRLNDSE